MKNEIYYQKTSHINIVPSLATTNHSNEKVKHEIGQCIKLETKTHN